MMHGCTEPSSTLQPYAFAIPAHNITDPIGANANAKIARRASKYKTHGNLLVGLAFIVAMLHHRITRLILRNSELSRNRNCIPQTHPYAERAEIALGAKR